MIDVRMINELRAHTRFLQEQNAEWRRQAEQAKERESFLLGVISYLYDQDHWYLTDEAPEMLAQLVADFGFDVDS